MKNQLLMLILIIFAVFVGCTSFTPTHDFIDISIHKIQTLALSSEKNSISNIFGYDKLIISFYSNETEQSRHETIIQLKAYCNKNNIVVPRSTYNAIEKYNTDQCSIGYIANNDFYMFPDYYNGLIQITKKGFIDPSKIVQVKAEGDSLKIVAE